MNDKYIKELFNSISKKYDLTNFAISSGVVRYWRKKFLNFIPEKEAKVLDACCGTGASTFSIWKKAGMKSTIYGVDFSSGMINIAKQRYSEYSTEDIPLSPRCSH